MSGEDLLKAWRETDDMEERNSLYERLKDENFFPKEDMEEWEVGLYPDYDDPEFLPKLLRKREFLESKQESVASRIAAGEKGCQVSEDFELSAVQRFVTRLLSPKTPYNSALLYHGVGVGKTCAAVSIAESFLEFFPRKKVFVVAPPAIQAGFKTTIFDKENLTMSASTENPNTYRGCTGNTYLELTHSMYEPTQSTVEARIAAKINTRYEFFGYTQLYKFIRKVLDRVPKSVTVKDRVLRENAELRREFSGRVLIVDEAHNLRDLPDEKEDEDIDAPSTGDEADATAGKRLTPMLRRVLDAAEGMKLVLLTATPIYNSYREIIFILNLLLKNDKKKELEETDIFYTSGVKAGTFRPGGKELLGRIASCYISFMRGENPMTFPVRLEPDEDLKIEQWATEAPNGVEIPEGVGERVNRLPIVKCAFSSDTEAIYQQLSDTIMEAGGGGLGLTNVDLLIQAGNWIFPADGEEDIRGRIRGSGFERTFRQEKRGTAVVYSTQSGDASWLREDRLVDVSGKAAMVVSRLRTCKGVAFVYSRFVPSGALSLALALEANGYTAWGRDVSLLGDGIQTEGGRQCALCEKKEGSHGGADHGFKPAKYVLLTGIDELSPNNPAAIKAARAKGNVDGGEIKVILGSQVAGEGLDLRFIREIYVFDSWFHLNKLEQVIGRGVRTCSHALLPEEKHNCTIYLLVNTYADTPEKETIDMYSYRTALAKAIVVGEVTRVLKIYAIDCSLNYDAITVTGLPPIRMIDGQGVERDAVNRNDIPFTALCDWLDDCNYECSVPKDDLVKLEESDSSSYDEYAARWRMNTLKKVLTNLFAKRTFMRLEDLQNAMGNIPPVLLTAILNSIIREKGFIIETARGPGRIVYRNRFFLFQPLQVEDVRIPLAVRMARLPVKRDSFEPKIIPAEKLRAPPTTVAGTAAAGEEEEKKGVDTEELWVACMAWAKRIEEGTQEEEVPEDMVTEIKRLSEGNTKLLRQKMERLEMIQWFYPEITEDDSARVAYAEAVRQYLWDEFISTDTQQDLILRGEMEGDAKRVVAHTKWVLEGAEYIRLYDSANGEIRNFAEGAPASAAVVEILQRDVGRDPIRSRPIHTGTTGQLYGLMVNKKSELIFKTSVPTAPGKKMERSARCSIDSNISYQIGKLVELGRILEGAKGNVMGLDGDTLTKTRPFKGSNRACTLLDLALRWMDVRRMIGKRWFYRPLEAKLLGHKTE